MSDTSPEIDLAAAGRAVRGPMEEGDQEVAEIIAAPPPVVLRVLLYTFGALVVILLAWSYFGPPGGHFRAAAGAGGRAGGRRSRTARAAALFRRRLPGARGCGAASPARLLPAGARADGGADRREATHPESADGPATKPL